MPRQPQKSVAVLALLVLCAAATVAESNAFTFPVFSAERVFHFLHRREVSGEAAAVQPTAGPSISPAQPPSSGPVAPAPSVSPPPSLAPAPIMPVAPALSPVMAPAPAPSTAAPTPAPAAEAPVIQSPVAAAPAPAIPSPPSPSPVPVPVPVPATSTSPAPTPATPPSAQDSAPPTDTLNSGAAGLAASTGALLVSAVAAMALC
ncbi:unnamed protein product [Urochloa humidicola]